MGMNELKNLDNKSTEIRTRSCELCLYEEIATYERAYINKEKHVQDIIQELKFNGLDVTNYKWYKHIRAHVRPEVGIILAENAPVLANEAVDKIGECIEAIGKVKEQIEKVEVSLNSDADPSLIRAYTALHAEARHWLEILAKLQGEFKDVAAIKVNNLNIEYNNVVGTIMQEACPVCKAKFAEKLAPQILKTAKSHEN